MLNFWQNVTRKIDLVYLFIKINGFNGQLGRSSFMKLVSFLFLICNVFFVFYIQPGQISVKFFSNEYFICFEWKYCTVSQNIIFKSFIYLHFSKCKFLIFCSIDWFRFQKPLAIDPYGIPRQQDFWGKTLGWFLGFQFISPFLPNLSFWHFFFHFLSFVSK